MVENQKQVFDFENYQGNFEFPEKLTDSFFENLEFYNLQRDITVVNYKKNQVIKNASLKFIKPDLLELNISTKPARGRAKQYGYKMRLFVLNHQTLEYEIKLKNSHMGRSVNSV